MKLQKIACLKMFQSQRNRRKYVIYLINCVKFMLDATAIGIGAALSFRNRFQNSGKVNPTNTALQNIPYAQLLIIISIGWLVTLYFSEYKNSNRQTILYLDPLKIVRPSVIYFFAIGFLSFMTKASFSRSIFFLHICSGIFLLVVSRILLFTFAVRPLIKTKRISTRLLIIGRTSKEIDQYVDWIIENQNLGYKVSGKLMCPEISFDWITKFDQFLLKNHTEEILILPGLEVDHNFIKFIHYLDDLKLHVNWVPLNSGNIGYWQIPVVQEGRPFLTFKDSRLTIWQICLKRIFDIIFSVFILILISPILLLISFLILFFDGLPILFFQKRIGKDGKKFNFIKFRTMVPDAELKLIDMQNSLGSKHILFKNKKDPRITPIGSFLRRYSLDELPQFINVLTNNMSVVGPRPALPREVSNYTSTYERRLIAKPGITGPWQIGGRSDLDLAASIALDLNYLTDWSFTRDLWIIIKTIKVVLSGKGAY